MDQVQQLKKEYQNWARNSCLAKNHALEIKVKTMDILFAQLVELEKNIHSEEPENRLETVKLMAELGKAILPD